MHGMIFSVFPQSHNAIGLVSDDLRAVCNPFFTISGGDGGRQDFCVPFCQSIFLIPWLIVAFLQ